jgi:hypothetical protein
MARCATTRKSHFSDIAIFAGHMGSITIRNGHAESAICRFVIAILTGEEVMRNGNATMSTNNLITYMMDVE